MIAADKEIELAATELASDVESAVAVGLVDTRTCPKAMRRAGFDHGPAIAVFRRGKKLAMGPHSYEARAVVNFVRYLTSPVSRRLEGTTQLNEYLRNATDVVVLGIFAHSSRQSRNAWIGAAEELRPPFRFAEASFDDAAGAKVFSGATLDPAKNQYAVVLPHKWVGKGETAFHLSADFRSMDTFVRSHCVSRVSALSGTSRALWKQQNKALVGLTIDMSRHGKMFKYVLNRLHKLLHSAPELERSFAFTIHDTKTIAGASRDFGIDAGLDFAVTVHNFTDESYFGSEMLVSMSFDNFSALPLAPWLSRIASGEQAPFVMSEEPPSGKAVGPGEVAIVTGRTFGEMVEDVRFDVLLALYEQTAPGATASELASRFRRMPSVRVAMMNVSANAYNGARYPYQGRGQPQYFMAPASADGKRAPLALNPARATDAVAVAEFALYYLARREPSEEYEETRRQVRLARRQQEEQREAMLASISGGGLGGEEEAKRKNKRRKRKKKSAKAKKEEL